MVTTGAKATALSDEFTNDESNNPKAEPHKVARNRTRKIRIILPEWLIK